MIKINRFYLLLVVVIAVFFVLGMLNPAGAEAATDREKALEEVREAIRALPALDKITAADRPAILAAQNLAAKAMADYGITNYEICTLSAKLGAAAAMVGLSGEQVALPPTGGLSAIIPLGFLSVLAGAAILLPHKRQK